MSLCNDNFWGYTTDIITKYQVRWIETAIVSPCWTAMLVFYVEGDWGHLLTEEMGAQKHRTAVKGSCFSFHMPWEDILDTLHQSCQDKETRVHSMLQHDTIHFTSGDNDNKKFTNDNNNN